jgi:hypothetical protein
MKDHYEKIATVFLQFEHLKKDHAAWFLEVEYSPVLLKYYDVANALDGKAYEELTEGDANNDRYPI